MYGPATQSRIAQRVVYYPHITFLDQPKPRIFMSTAYTYSWDLSTALNVLKKLACRFPHVPAEELAKTDTTSQNAVAAFMLVPCTALSVLPKLAYRPLAGCSAQVCQLGVPAAVVLQPCWAHIWACCNFHDTQKVVLHIIWY